MKDVVYKLSPRVTNGELNALFADAWPGPHQNEDFSRVLRHSLGYVCAYKDGELVGFVNVAWDGAAGGLSALSTGEVVWRSLR